MPLSVLQVLQKIAYERMQSEAGKKQIEGEVMLDAMEEGGLVP